MSSVIIKRTFESSAEKVLNAWLDPESIKIWLCPMEGVTVPSPIVDPKVGGSFQFDMQMGEKILPHKGEYKVIDHPQKLQFTWRSAGTNDENSIVTIDIKPVNPNFCELTLTHELLPSEEAVKNHTGGWNNILDTLKKALA